MINAQEISQILPERLTSGDEIRVVSPSSSLARIGGLSENKRALDHLERLGFKVTFGKNIRESDVLHSASIASRVEDLHEAFSDKNVKAILSTIGGFNSNELLPYLDYELIRNNPKIICGYSDITALNHGITVKTGLVTYIGPHFSSFKMGELQEYQTENFLRVLQQSSCELASSTLWSSDEWYDKSIPRKLLPTEWKIYNEGTATDISFGGNLNTFNLLNGTEYQPKIKRGILFVESAEENPYVDFARDLASVLQVFPKISGLVIGRFPKENDMSEERLVYILNKYPHLKHIPVMYDVDFGHTQPIFTFPIGQKITLDTYAKRIMIH